MSRPIFVPIILVLLLIGRRLLIRLLWFHTPFSTPAHVEAVQGQLVVEFPVDPTLIPLLIACL
jgi:hypothetical protein